MAIFPFEQAIKNIFLLSAKAFPAKLEQSQTDHMLSGVLEETLLTVADLNVYFLLLKPVTIVEWICNLFFLMELLSYWYVVVIVYSSEHYFS